ncbi:MAG: phosphatidate cytidylyltransferase [Xanthobacteraceae bacterium]
MSGDALTRALSGIILAVLAIAAAVVGGWPFVLFWTAAAIGVFWEWSAIVAGAARVARIGGILAIAAAGSSALAGHPLAMLAVLAIGTGVLGVMAPGMRLWSAGGVLYAGLVLASPVLLRRDPEFGMTALLYLFAIVWATDILAYAGGRLIGGRKLAPAISPKKTWSGAITGTLAGIGAGTAAALIAGLANPLAAAGLALLLSAVAQAGDLGESAVKRHFGVKDSSRIIPGHGGLMDRLDGFLAAATAAAVLGVVRGGFDGAAGGLLLW